MCKAIMVANKLLEIADNNGDLITNLKLQKLLYYAQAWYMVNNNGKVLFDDKIEAWMYGPVVREVYDEYKRFNSSPILYSKVKDKNFSFTKKQETYLQEFAESFFKYSATELVSMTHNEKPWKEACAKKDKVIDTTVMYKFYKGLLSEQEKV